MNKLLTLSIAFVHLDIWLTQEKVSYSQYLECIDDIKKILNISQDEYLESLNSKWVNNTKSILEVN